MSTTPTTINKTLGGVSPSVMIRNLAVNSTNRDDQNNLHAIANDVYALESQRDAIVGALEKQADRIAWAIKHGIPQNEDWWQVIENDLRTALRMAKGEAQ